MRLPIFVALLAGAAAALAAPPPVTGEAYLRAAVVVGAFDRLVGECTAAGGFRPEQRRAIDDWHVAHQVERIRARLPELGAHPAQREQLAQAVERITGELAAQGLAPCLAAAAVTRLPFAQFASVAPELLSEAAPAVAASPPPTAAAPAAAVLADIDSIGFHTRPTMGIGGFIALDIFPVLLLRSGDLVKDVTALAAPGGLAAHRAAHPEQWTQWRRSGGEIQLMTTEGWRKLGFQTTYATLPADLRLDGNFRALGGVGNVAVGGTDSVIAWDAYRFTPGGRVERTGGAGAHAAFGEMSVASAANHGLRRGRYRIDGLMLIVDYDDGGSERRVLVIDPKDPDTALWLDGAAYVQRD